MIIGQLLELEGKAISEFRMSQMAVTLQKHFQPSETKRAIPRQRSHRPRTVLAPTLKPTGSVKTEDSSMMAGLRASPGAKAIGPWRCPGRFAPNRCDSPPGGCCETAVRIKRVTLTFSNASPGTIWIHEA